MAKKAASVNARSAAKKVNQTGPKHPDPMTIDELNSLKKWFGEFAATIEAAVELARKKEYKYGDTVYIWNRATMTTAKQVAERFKLKLMESITRMEEGQPYGPESQRPGSRMKK
jgi:hypothetical protein